MTLYVETDFLIALTTDGPRGVRAERVLESRDVVTSPVSYLELLTRVDREAFDAVHLVAHLLDVVPVASDREEQVVLKTANYYDEGLSPFEAFHAATAETRELPMVSPNEEADPTGPERLALGAE